MPRNKIITHIMTKEEELSFQDERDATLIHNASQAFSNVINDRLTQFEKDVLMSKDTEKKIESISIWLLMIPITEKTSISITILTIAILLTFILMKG